MPVGFTLAVLAAALRGFVVLVVGVAHFVAVLQLVGLVTISDGSLDIDIGSTALPFIYCKINYLFL